MSVQLINLVILVAIVNGVCSLVKFDGKLLPNLNAEGSNYPLTNPKTEFRIALVSDLEIGSKIHELESVFYSYFKVGSLIYDPLSQEVDVKFDSGAENGTQVYSVYGNKKNRGFELSELSYFDGNLLASDDQTGLIFLYQKGTFKPWVAVPRSSKEGDTGDEIEVSEDKKKLVVMPIEWATAKGDILYVGPNGSDRIQYVAKVNKNGDIEHIDFSEQFKALKNKAGMENGYMVHESCVYSEEDQKFYFLPKKASTAEYSDQADLENAVNILLSLSNDMNTVEKVADIKHPTVYKDRGYSSFAFVPNTKDKIIVALQTSDVTNSTYITAFTKEGYVVLNSTKVSDVKYEGLAFL